MPPPTVAVSFFNLIITRIMSIEPIKRQSLISLANIIGLTLLGYIATMYFAHVLGPAVLGSYYLFLSYYGVFSMIGDGGFGGAAIKRISEGKEPNEYFSAFVVLRIFLLAISISALLFLAPYFKDFSSSGLLPWLIVALIAGTMVSFVSAGIYGTAKVGVAQISDFINNVVKIITQIIATYLGYSAAGLAGGFVAGIIAGFILNFHYFPLKLVKYGVSHLKSLFSFSFWTFLTYSGFTIFATADTILIGYYLSNTEVGIYRVAYQMTGAALFVCTAVNTTLYPRMSQWNTERDPELIRAALTRAISFSLLLAIPVVAGGIILGDELLFYLYGADFVSGTYALIVLLMTQILTIFVTLQITCINAMDCPKISFYTTAVAAMLNIVLNILLIPLLGILGAALATFICVTLNAILSYKYLSQHLKFVFKGKSVLNFVISALVMAGAVLTLRLFLGIPSLFYLLGIITSGALIYFLVLFQIDPKLRQEVREFFSVIGLG